MPIITVTQVNKYIGSKLKSDKILQGILVKGEISNFVRHYKSGHCYFSLKDSESVIKAVMFSAAAERLKFMPQDGMAVVVSGSVSVYERDGAYQLYVNDIIPEGKGKEGAALDQLKKKLEKEGLFSSENKRSLPQMPAKIGAVTSLSGAAVRDIINVLSRRYPLCELYAVNALVQGENAPQSISEGIFKAEAAGCDVIIVGRGGGSSEDLGAFNTEVVARAIYNCKVPIISAVGHEVDHTIADLTADMRAPTPSAAAELAAPDIHRIMEFVDNYSARLKKAGETIIDRKINEYSSLYARLAAQSPENRLKLMDEKIENLCKRAGRAALSCIDKNSAELAEKIGRLESLSPLKVMARGYSLVYKNDRLVRSSDEISEGDRITLRFGNGGAEAEIGKKW